MENSDGTGNCVSVSAGEPGYDTAFDNLLGVDGCLRNCEDGEVGGRGFIDGRPIGDDGGGTLIDNRGASDSSEGLPAKWMCLLVDDAAGGCVRVLPGDEGYAEAYHELDGADGCLENCGGGDPPPIKYACVRNPDGTGFCEAVGITDARYDGAFDELVGAEGCIANCADDGYGDGLIIDSRPVDPGGTLIDNRGASDSSEDLPTKYMCLAANDAGGGCVPVESGDEGYVEAYRELDGANGCRENCGGGDPPPTKYACTQRSEGTGYCVPVGVDDARYDGAFDELVGDGGCIANCEDEPGYGEGEEEVVEPPNGGGFSNYIDSEDTGIDSGGDGSFIDSEDTGIDRGGDGSFTGSEDTGIHGGPGGSFTGSVVVTIDENGNTTADPYTSRVWLAPAPADANAGQNPGFGWVCNEGSGKCTLIEVPPGVTSYNSWESCDGKCDGSLISSVVVDQGDGGGTQVNDGILTDSGGRGS